MQQPNSTAGTGALSYETCVALRDAGFPQSKCGTPGMVDNPCTYSGRNPDGTNHYVACPNVGELLAELQRRWPTLENLGLEDATDHKGSGWYAWGGPCEGRGDTPEAACAALWLRLAQAGEGT